MDWHLLHPAAVHFPAALVWTALLLELRAWHRKDAALAEGAAWVFALAALSAGVAAATGWLAEETAPHVPVAWEALADHKARALWAAGILAALGLWRFTARSRWESARKERGPFVLAWLMAALWTTYAAHAGGRLVYEFGMGLLSR